LQAVSQQKPSTQLPLAQTLHGPVLQSTPLVKLHVLPSDLDIVHCPLVAQYSPVPHWVSDVHAVAHVELMPSHANGAQDGRPNDPAGAMPHVPGVPASPFKAHDWQDALQAVLQQNPSTQFPVLHSRQPGTLQSPPVPVLHELPCGTCCTHLLFAPQ
jgi:hypothetical protein